MSAGKKLAILLIGAGLFVGLFVLINYGKTIWPIVAEWFMDLWQSANN